MREFPQAHKEPALASALMVINRIVFGGAQVQMENILEVVIALEAWVVTLMKAAVQEVVAVGARAVVVAAILGLAVEVEIVVDVSVVAALGRLSMISSERRHGERKQLSKSEKLRLIQTQYV